MPEMPVYAQTAVAVLSALGTPPTGLTGAEAAARLAADGPNRLPQAARPGLLRRFGGQLNNLLIYVLLASACAAFAMGHLLDGGVILGVVILNALIGLIQEGRAEQALAAIANLTDPQAVVIRAGTTAVVQAADLVRGDLVRLEPGTRVPADLRLVEAHGLFADEAVLTGESLPVQKDVAPVAPGAGVGDRFSMAHAGSLITAGEGLGLVVATGSQTELGRISGLLAAVASTRTPLLDRMDRFAAQVAGAVLLLSALMITFAVLVRGLPPAEALIAAIAFAVAAIPEGLPAVLSITMAIGVERMARRQAIIRHLPAVETLGSVTVICTDKTGTLTRNELEVAGLYGADGTVLDPLAARTLLRHVLAALDDQGRGAADPLDRALMAAARAAGVDAGGNRLAYYPFDTATRIMGSLTELDGSPVLCVKGAPEQVMDRLDGMPPKARAAWAAAMHQLAGQGHRVLAAAAAPWPGPPPASLPARLGARAHMLGLIAFYDPPRAEAADALSACRDAGVRVVMITGDHAATAGAIARQLGMNDGSVISGAGLDAGGDLALEDAARSATVLARAAPEHKIALVNRLRAHGHIVAMTGDGVNDAPALKAAHVGIAMGQKGSDAAKEAAVMVLGDDNFASIVAAIREGRIITGNIRRVIAFALPANLGQGLTILLALLMGMPLPVTPVQVLWVNMVAAVTLGTALAFNTRAGAAMARPPRPADQALLGRALMIRMSLATILLVAGAFWAFAQTMAAGGDEALARTLTVNAIIAMESGFLAALTPGRFFAPPPLPVVAAIALVWLAQMAFTYLPPLQQVFGGQALGLQDWGLVLALGVGFYLIVRVERWWAWAKGKKQ